MKHNVCSLRRVALGMATLLAVAAAGACKQKEQDKAEAKVAADGGPDAGPVGPCGEYAAKICESAGEQSSTCQSVKTTADLLPPAACKIALKNTDYATKKLAIKRRSCDELVTKLCKDIGKETETCEMVTTQTKKFPPERCQMMLGRYDEVVKDLKRREVKNKPLDQNQQKAVAASGGPSFGPENAKVTIVEFSDFQCPFCSKAASAVEKIRAKYADRVRFVFHEFPLSFHSNARSAAEAALEAYAQGKFWQFHDKLFKNQGKLDAASLEGYATELGLNLPAFKKAMSEHKHGPEIEADLKLGQDVGVQGTPTMFLNGARVANPSDAEALGKAIDKALEAAH